MFFVWDIWGKTLLFPSNLDFTKNEQVKFWKIYKWYLYGYCLYFIKVEWGGGGHRWNIEKGLSQIMIIIFYIYSNVNIHLPYNILSCV